jgi:membrane-associated phospholipid phosphatase
VVKILFLLFVFFLVFPFDSFGQAIDRVTHQKRSLKWIAPAALILTGTGLMLDSDADEFFLSNLGTREERNEHFLSFSNHADDYLQYAPAAAGLIISISGVEGKHTLPNQIALFIKSEFVMTAVVYSLKYTVGEARPDSGQKNSFPSGHTAQAFSAATFLSKEYGHKSIWISIGAYTAASTVGVFRMLNNRHWVSDVFVGAGIGILSTEFVYFTHKNRWGKKKLSVNPFSTRGSKGLTLRYSF